MSESTPYKFNSSSTEEGVDARKPWLAKELACPFRHRQQPPPELAKYTRASNLKITSTKRGKMAFDAKNGDAPIETGLEPAIFATRSSKKAGKQRLTILVIRVSKEVGVSLGGMMLTGHPTKMFAERTNY